MNKEDKSIQYATAILGKIQELFEEEVRLDDLKEDDNMTEFIHALANMVPTMVYNKFTNEQLNTLDFNHIANKLVFQYSNKEE